MSLQELLTWGSAQLNQAGVPSAELDARYLLFYVFDLKLAAFLTARSQWAAEEKKQQYQKLIARRAKRVPLQQIIGTQEFMGLEFAVDENVLIPRQDTETLVELILKQEQRQDICLLDLCTGSGCIAISLARLGGYSQVWALDISQKALKVAEGNASRLLSGYGGSWRLFHSDLFSAVPEGSRFDVLVSNPPYIPAEIIEQLEPEVRDYEPRLALDGQEDGLAFYRRLARESGAYLKPGGRIYLEIGWDQAEAVTGLLRESGFQNIQVEKDLAGLDRVVWASRSGR